MGSLCSKLSQTVEEEEDDNYKSGNGKSTEETQKEFLKKYGRLDWGCQEPTNEEKAKAGKRYEGHSILMNLNS